MGGSIADLMNGIADIIDKAIDAGVAIQEAIAKANGADFAGRNIVVSVARPKEDRPRGDFGGGNGGGGRGDRGGYRNDR